MIVFSQISLKWCVPWVTLGWYPWRTFVLQTLLWLLKSWCGLSRGQVTIFLITLQKTVKRREKVANQAKINWTCKISGLYVIIINSTPLNRTKMKREGLTVVQNEFWQHFCRDPYLISLWMTKILAKTVDCLRHYNFVLGPYGNLSPTEFL